MCITTTIEPSIIGPDGWEVVNIQHNSESEPEWDIIELTQESLGSYRLHNALQQGGSEAAILSMLGSSQQARLEFNINATDKLGTLIYTAAAFNYIQVAHRLIELGANVNTQFSSNTKLSEFAGETPLHAAAKQGNQVMVELLINNGADTSIESKRRITPSQAAEKAGHPEIAKLIKEYDSGVQVSDKNTSSWSSIKSWWRFVA